MTHAQVQAAIESGQPFTIFMADGKEYEVPHPELILVHPKASLVSLAASDEAFYVLSMLTMTGLKYQGPADNVQA